MGYHKPHCLTRILLPVRPNRQTTPLRIRRLRSPGVVRQLHPRDTPRVLDILHLIAMSHSNHFIPRHPLSCRARNGARVRRFDLLQFLQQVKTRFFLVFG